MLEGRETRKGSFIIPWPFLALNFFLTQSLWHQDSSCKDPDPSSTQKNSVINPYHLIRRNLLFPEPTLPVNTSTPEETAHTLPKATETGSETRQALASKIFWLTGFSFLSLLICLLLCNWRSLVKENGPVSSWGASVISLVSVWLHCVYLGGINIAPIFPPSGFPYRQGCQASYDAVLSLQWILHAHLRIFLLHALSLNLSDTGFIQLWTSYWLVQLDGQPVWFASEWFHHLWMARLSPSSQESI